MTTTVYSSIEDLVAGATGRRELRPDDARSGATFETLRLDGRRRFLKVLSQEADWVMRVTGNSDHWEYKVWQAGIYDRFPASIDHTILGMALDETGPPRLGILMDDCTGDLIPPGDDPVTLDVHAGFIASMADLHASLWGWTDDLGLCPMANRLRFFAPDVIAPELAVDDVPGPIVAAERGWALLAERAPELSALVHRLHADPAVLVDAFAATPVTFVSGDWKMGNLGVRPDGRTILLDQAYPGSGPCCWDLAWYLALNRERLPETKEATIDRYRRALEHAGINTGAWWDAHLGLCTIGIVTTFGWEKALGDDDELAWWATRALAAEELLR